MTSSTGTLLECPVAAKLSQGKKNPPNLSSLSSSRPMIVNASSSDRQLECGLFVIGGGELAKLCDSGGNDFERVGDVGGGSVAAEAEANAGAGFVRG